MTHVLCGLILSAEDAQNLSANWDDPHVVPLSAGLTMLPLTDARLDNVFGVNPDSETVAGFVYLHEQMLAELKVASSSGRLCYLETDYFGGMGGQGAVLLEDGRILFGPSWAEMGPINSALSFFGLPERENGMDRFDQLGLGRHRRTEDWQ